MAKSVKKESNKISSKSFSAKNFISRRTIFVSFLIVIISLSGVILIVRLNGICKIYKYNNSLKEYVDKSTGIELAAITDCESNFITLLTGPGYFARPLASDEVERSVAEVKLAMRKYPSYLLKKNLKKVLILKVWLAGDQVIGGMNINSRKEIILSTESPGIRGTHPLQQVFHHEFGHTLQET